MKSLYKIILLIIISHSAFGQKISFDLSNSNIKINGITAKQSDTLNLNTQKGSPIIFAIEIKTKPDTGFHFILYVNKRKVDLTKQILLKDSIKTDENLAIQTDTNLIDKRLFLNRGFTIEVPSLHIKQAFAFKQPYKHVLIPFYDAITLKNYTTINRDSLYNLLVLYNSGIDGQVPLTNMITKNPFFPDSLKTGLNAFIAIYCDSLTKLKNKNLLGINASASALATPGTLPSIGGLDVTNIANGISDLLIERGKEELTVAFFDRFKTFSTAHPEFQILFPATTSNLNNLLTYSYPQMIPALRLGFMNDLKQIPYNLDGVLELPKYQLLLENFPEVTVAIRSIKLLHQLETGTSNAADIINEFANFPEWKKQGSIGFENMANTLQLAAIFSQSLRTNKKDTTIWVSAADVDKMLANNGLTQIYLGLLYQQIYNKGIKFHVDSKHPATTERLADILAAQKSVVILFQSKIAAFITIADKVTLTYKSLKSAINAKKLTDSAIYNYINISLDAVDYSCSIVKLFDTTLTSDQYLTIARKANSLYRDVYSKQYTAIVSDAVDFLTEVHDLTKDNTSNSRADTLAVGPLNSLFDFVEKVKPYALLMANIVEAKTSDDVKTALENAILPVGSYSIKQKAICNISVNAYIGYAYDFNTIGLNKVYAHGVYAPIGFSFTFNVAHIFNSKNGSTAFLTPTVFASVFDLGSIVSYKMSNTNTPSGSTNTMNQQIKIESIFSPSLQLLLGIRGTPIAIGAGWRKTPTLFYSGNGTYTTVAARDVFNVTALIDIPFFTLHNKQFNQ